MSGRRDWSSRWLQRDEEATTSVFVLGVCFYICSSTQYLILQSAQGIIRKRRHVKTLYDGRVLDRETFNDNGAKTWKSDHDP